MHPVVVLRHLVMPQNAANLEEVAILHEASL